MTNIILSIIKKYKGKFLFVGGLLLGTMITGALSINLLAGYELKVEAIRCAYIREVNYEYLRNYNISDSSDRGMIAFINLVKSEMPQKREDIKYAYIFSIATGNYKKLDIANLDTTLVDVKYEEYYKFIILPIYEKRENTLDNSEGLLNDLKDYKRAETAYNNLSSLRESDNIIKSIENLSKIRDFAINYDMDIDSDPVIESFNSLIEKEIE